MYPCSSLENTWEWMFIPPNLVGQRLVFTHPQTSVVLKRPCFGPCYAAGFDDRGSSFHAGKMQKPLFLQPGVLVSEMNMDRNLHP